MTVLNKLHDIKLIWTGVKCFYSLITENEKMVLCYLVSTIYFDEAMVDQRMSSLRVAIIPKSWFQEHDQHMLRIRQD